MLAGLPNTVSKEKYGPRLMEATKGEAEVLLEGIDVDAICSEGGTNSSSRLWMRSTVPSLWIFYTLP